MALQRGSSVSHAYPAHTQQARCKVPQTRAEPRKVLDLGGAGPRNGLQDFAGPRDPGDSHRTRRNTEGLTEGTHSLVFVCSAPPQCVCTTGCEWPCWQRIGLTEHPCCHGCRPLPEVTP